MYHISASNSVFPAYRQDTWVWIPVQLRWRSVGNTPYAHMEWMQIAFSSSGRSHTTLHLEHLPSPPPLLQPESACHHLRPVLVAGAVFVASTLSIYSNSWGALYILCIGNVSVPITIRSMLSFYTYPCFSWGSEASKWIRQCSTWFTVF